MQRIKKAVLNVFHISTEMIIQYYTNPVYLLIFPLISVVVWLPWLQLKPLCYVPLVLINYWIIIYGFNVRIELQPELENRLNSLNASIAELRRTQHGKFCTLASAAFSAIGIIAQCSYSYMLMLVLVIVVIIKAPQSLKITKINNPEEEDIDLSYLNTARELKWDDEFLPEENESNMFVLERASVEATIASGTDDGEIEDKSEEIPSELLLPDCIPEVDESSTDDEQYDLLPIARIENLAESPIFPKDEKADYSEIDDEIAFKKIHFKRRSLLSYTSSSSEESLSKGLEFPDHMEVMTSSQEASSSTLRSTKSLSFFNTDSKFLPTHIPIFMESLFGIKPPKSRPVVSTFDSSDESDFELLERDDIQ